MTVVVASLLFLFGALSIPSQVSGQALGTTDTSQVVVVPITSGIFKNTRSMRVYLPPGYRADTARRFPVLYLNDGFSVFSERGWHARTTIDSLIRTGAIVPLIVVGIDNAATIPGAKGGDDARTNEYLPFPDSTEPNALNPRGFEYADFVVREVMPLVEARFRAARDPEHIGVGGSSYGGLAALATVVRHPGRFGALLLESAPLFLSGERLTDAALGMTMWPRHIYIGLGTRETDDPVVDRLGRSAVDRFVRGVHERSPSTGVLFNLVEGATHTSRAWGARFPTALSYLFRSQ